MDLFAAFENTFLPCFVSLYPDLHAEAVDALSLPSGCHVVPSASNGTTNMSSSFLRLACGQPSFARPEQTGPGAARGVLVAPFAITGVEWLALMAGQPLSLDLHHMIVALLSPLLQQALPMAPDGQFLLSTSPLSPSLSLARARFPSPHPSPARRPVSPVRVRH